VVGIPDEQFGELCVAFVAPEAGVSLTQETCEAHCKPRIGIRTPRRWIFVDQLPRTGNGKVDKAALRGQLAVSAAQ
jgi:acyl-coenzyme A synthetase/AMP-(fatty) acid ligase